jgi:hypothetical protein
MWWVQDGMLRSRVPTTHTRYPQMVLDAGRLVEFDKPAVLLSRDQGLLKAIVDESMDREKLRKMAGL